MGIPAQEKPAIKINGAPPSIRYSASAIHQMRKPHQNVVNFVFMVKLEASGPLGEY
jgi:hypothetical protein